MTNTNKPARVEAWVVEAEGCRQWVLGVKPGDRDTTIAYLTTFPGVHNAADAEAFEAAVRGAFHFLHDLVECGVDPGGYSRTTRLHRDALARFLAPEAGR